VLQSGPRGTSELLELADHADWSTPDSRLSVDCDRHVALARENLPTGAVLCVIFVWVCLLGLLFLLMKERTISGQRVSPLDSHSSDEPGFWS
jgi:hypothetical protein